MKNVYRVYLSNIMVKRERDKVQTLSNAWNLSRWVS